MIVRLLALLFVLCFATAAPAQTVVWSTPGSACVPDQATIMDNRHTLGLASVEPAGNKVARITLNCPIAPFTSELTHWHLFINYRDSTGAGTAAFVRAKLYRLGLKNNTASPILLATVSSNSSATMTNTSLASPFFIHTFRFNTGTYWVQVELDRSSASETVILQSTFIQDAP